MSEIEKAIHFLSDYVSRIDYRLECAIKVPCRPFYEKLSDAIHTAIFALQEKLEREKDEPVAWIKRDIEDTELLAICPKCNYPVSWFHRTPCCPNCGKKLEV